MGSTAIIIGNANYRRAARLECCLEDLKAMEALVAAIGRHDVVRVAADADADRMREVVRDALTASGEIKELLFYFTGHGAQIGAEFYFCGTGFDASRPNETGVSHGELHEMLRSAEPDLLVKIVDACASGTPLIKSSLPVVPLRKDGLRNVVQLSSCMVEQSSFTGETLSEFTAAFLSACLRRLEGPVYYSDVNQHAEGQLPRQRGPDAILCLPGHGSRASR